MRVSYSDTKIKESLVKIFREALSMNNFEALHDFDKRVGRKSSVEGCSHDHHHHDHHGHCAPLPNDEVLESIIIPVIEKAERIFHGVKERGEKAEEILVGEEAEYVRLEIIKEAIVQELVKRESEKQSRQAASLATNKFYYANPRSVDPERSKELLNQLDSKVIHDLMTQGFGISRNFIGMEIYGNIFRELEFCDASLKFKELHETTKRQLNRSDSFFFASVEEFDRERQNAIREVSEKLIALPFELNSKVQDLSLQVSTQLSYGVLRAKTKIGKHFDCGKTAENDNNRFVTALLFVQDEDDADNQIKIQIADGNEEIVEIENGLLLLVKAREIPYEIQGKSKIFFITNYITRLSIESE